jgi:hypothetical protein
MSDEPRAIIIVQVIQSTRCLFTKLYRIHCKILLPIEKQEPCQDRCNSMMINKSSTNCYFDCEIMRNAVVGLTFENIHVCWPGARLSPVVNISSTHCAKALRCLAVRKLRGVAILPVLHCLQCLAVVAVVAPRRGCGVFRRGGMQPVYLLHVKGRRGRGGIVCMRTSIEAEGCSQGSA